MSSTPTIDLVVQETSRLRGAATRNRYFFHPAIDFLCLGGGSILLVLFLAIIGVGDHNREMVASVALAIAHLINNPHFAHSYQLFYRGYLSKVSSASTVLRGRYLFSGLLFPLLLIAFFIVAVSRGDVLLLGQAANLMGLLVGWHYVKQGYGVLIAVSVLQRCFFSASEKKNLLLNAYCCWISFWLATNWVVAERNFWGIKQFMLNIPNGILVFSLCLSAFTSCLVAVNLIQKWRASRNLPINGLIAYVATLYVWLALLVNPVFALIIPACHSLQYLVIVWRYRLNFEHDLNKAPAVARSKPYSDSSSFRFVVFVSVGTLLGFLGFWQIPELLDGAIPYNHEVFGPSLFLYLFWIFINVHHYFIDNVIWRSENTDTKKFLFRHDSR